MPTDPTSGAVRRPHVRAAHPAAVERVGCQQTQRQARYADHTFERHILLPLSVYDDKSLVFRHPEEWADVGFPLMAQALKISPTGSGSYQPCIVLSYDRKKFLVRWAPKSHLTGNENT